MTTPEQLQGLKLRFPGKYYSYWGEKLGVQPVTMSGSEALAAIQNGTIEGHVTTDTLYVDRKQYEAAPYVTLFDITAYTYILAANKDAWNSLADDTKAAVTKAAEKFQSELRTAMTQATIDYRARMREHATVTEMTPEQRAVWEASGKTTWDQYVADNPAGRALVDAAIAARD